MSWSYGLNVRLIIYSLFENLNSVDSRIRKKKNLLLVSEGMPMQYESYICKQDAWTAELEQDWINELREVYDVSYALVN